MNAHAPGGDIAAAADRDRLAAAQAALLRALVGGAPAPPGFDPDRIRLQADALVAKRREVVARIRPDLAAGTDFRARFDRYARQHPRPAAGARSDAEAFARSLPAAPARRTLWSRLTARPRWW